MVQFCTILHVFNFTYWKCIFCFNSRFTAFFWKLPTGQCSCKSVKTGYDIPSSKIYIFKQNLDRMCILTLEIDQMSKNWKIWRISRFFQKELYFGKFRNEILDRDTQCQTNILLVYKVPQASFTSQKMKALSICPL